VTIRSEPGNATVFAGGKAIGVTPLESYSMKPGPATLRLERSGYQPLNLSFALLEGRDTTIAVQLAAALEPARLILRAVPSGKILVDGTPVEAGTRAVAAGSHAVEFRHPTLGSKTVSVSMAQAETRSITCYFESYLSVIATPAYGYIWVDGRNTEISTPQARYPLPVGKHRVTVKRLGYKAVEGEVEVNVEPELSEKVVELVFTLVSN
jgi:hypothetical protein